VFELPGRLFHNKYNQIPWGQELARWGAGGFVIEELKIHIVWPLGRKVFLCELYELRAVDRELRDRA